MTDIQLYNKAKEAYYNGEPIMTDYEFDELEKKLGLENKSYVGTRHNPKYTVEHPFIMGSLSKVQIHKSKNGTIDWGMYFELVKKYIKNNTCIITPKFDGCSFETRCSNNVVSSISSRGDGEFGSDYYKHLIKLVQPTVDILNISDEYVLRGEVLIDKTIFKTKYSQFVNPRSFVSGILNRDYSNDSEFQEMINDLSIVIYEIRTKNGSIWNDIDWNKFLYPSAPAFFVPSHKIETAEDFENIYNKFSEYRDECEFALDGIVIKTTDDIREQNVSLPRPKDCVAIKFVPMLEETVVEEIKWNLGKTGEYIPTIKVKPVTMDGKQVSKASAFNYGYLIEKKISVGTKVILSLAGDIIPFIYKITDTSDFSESNLMLPDTNYEIDGCHLMASLSENEKRCESLYYSILSLNLDGMGPAAAHSVVDYMKEICAGDEFFGTEEKEIPNNALLLSPTDIQMAIGGKTGDKIRKSFETVLKSLDLKTIIKSCNFKFCGESVSTQISNKLLGLDYDFASMPSEGYNWCFNENSENYKLIMKIMKTTGHSINDYKEVETLKVEKIDTSNKIAVILTGDPNNYKSKADFRNSHPEYYEVSPTKKGWSECKILFTNSLESKTAKMKKALELGIEIREY